jgi:hypothetical protein
MGDQMKDWIALIILIVILIIAILKCPLGKIKPKIEQKTNHSSILFLQRRNQ